MVKLFKTDGMDFWLAPYITGKARFSVSWREAGGDCCDIGGVGRACATDAGCIIFLYGFALGANRAAHEAIHANPKAGPAVR